MYTHNIFLIEIYFIKEGVKGMSLTSPQNSLAYGSMEIVPYVCFVSPFYDITCHWPVETCPYVSEGTSLAEAQLRTAMTIA